MSKTRLRTIVENLVGGIALWTVTMPCILLAQDSESGELLFRDKIEPLLASHCLDCHSHAGEISGGLTLDSRSGWVEGGDSGPAIVPGNADESLLIKAVRRHDAELQMPPDDPLDAESIELLVEWINLGAPDPRSTVPITEGISTDWWSWKTLERPAIPSGQDSTHPIDAFIREKLLENNLTPAPQADRRTLIRRLYFDLHGLPPSLEDVNEFVSDDDPLAYDHLVDELLASPRYGERWARHWLDTVHFADSNGCEHDTLRPSAWRYRDYVIDSFNRDTLWPRFIREQLAADHFFPTEPNLTVALGFISAGPMELSRAATAPVTFDYFDRDDIVTQTMSAFTSATANCARCHDHKFDPISQEDYYSLQAVFAGAGKGEIEFDRDADTGKSRRHWNKLIEAVKQNDQSSLGRPEFASIVSQWESEFSTTSALWQLLTPNAVESAGQSDLQVLADKSVLATGVRPERDTYTITAQPNLKRLTAVRLDVLLDDSLPHRGPGRQDNGNLHLTEFEVYLLNHDSNERTRLPIRQATADWNQSGWTISHAIDGNVATAWGVYPRVGESHQAVFTLDQPCELTPASSLVVVIQQLHGEGHLIGRVKLYASDAEGAAVQMLPDSVASAMDVPHDQRTPDQHNVVKAYALERYANGQLAALPAASTVFAVSDRYSYAIKRDAPLAPKTVHVLLRGDIEKPGEVALPGTLSAIAGLPGRFDRTVTEHERLRRAALADWIAAPDNPLTWRSIVNRIWQYHFGRGICDTPNDLGRMGGTPSHPELLDWMAVWFRDDAAGSLKELHRLMVTSTTYQQRSDCVGESSVDSENRLLWRMNRRRLDAESYRDAVLQISGRLDATMGGPGIEQFVKTQGPQETPSLDYDAFDWDSPGAGRRSIYRVVWRGIQDPFMEQLDFPDLGLLAPTRGTSVSSLQSLALYNNDFVLHHSEVLSKLLTHQDANLDQQLKHAYLRIFLREPSEVELAAVTQYAEQYGLAATCRILLNSNEFLFVP